MLNCPVRGSIIFRPLLLALCATPAYALTFPDPSIPQNSAAGSNRSHGVKNAVYFVIRDVDAPELSSEKTAHVRASELTTRRFLAENSGGQFDLYYDHIVDVPLQLDANNRRPANWRTLADQYVKNNYGINLTDYYAHVYDLSATAPDPSQSWSGIYYGLTDVAIQSTSQLVVTHELLHRASAEHASAWRALSNASFTPYTWDSQSGEYVSYLPGVSPHDPLPMGVVLDEYGNPFDVMGNLTTGHVRAAEKARALGWIDESQLGNLDLQGEGTFRIYAHDELRATTDATGVHGVEQTYAEDVYYGLTFSRAAQRLKTSGPGVSTWESFTQRIDLEYRQGMDSVLFYLDAIDGFPGYSPDNAILLDMNPAGGTSRNDRERGLPVGASIEDIAFGLSTYFVDDPADPDFLSLNPPPPSHPTMLRHEWFHLHVLGTGSDSIGSYIELDVSLVTPLTGIAGDLNQDYRVTQTDYLLFRANWRTDTSAMSSLDRYRHGDLNLDGVTDLRDAALMRNALRAHGIQGNLLGPVEVPEPATLPLAVLATLLVVCSATRRRITREFTPEPDAIETDPRGTFPTEPSFPAASPTNRA